MIKNEEYPKKDYRLLLIALIMISERKPITSQRIPDIPISLVIAPP